MVATTALPRAKNGHERGRPRNHPSDDAPAVAVAASVMTPTCPRRVEVTAKGVAEPEGPDRLHGHVRADDGQNPQHRARPRRRSPTPDEEPGAEHPRCASAVTEQPHGPE